MSSKLGREGLAQTGEGVKIGGMFAEKNFRAGWMRRLRAIRGEGDFDRLAIELFLWQAKRNAGYRSYLRNLAVLPHTVRSWREIPAVPQELFKRKALFSHRLQEARHLYLTSGTTTGRSGRNRLLDIDLYRAGALAAVENLGPKPFAGKAGTLPLLFLTPSPRRNPHSSLSAMFGFFKQRWGASGAGSGFFVEEGVLQLGRFLRALEKAVAAGKPVGVLGTAFSFVHLIDSDAPRMKLPAGSFLLETGGFKGRSRTVEKAELYRALAARLGVPAGAIWNEYGMTELSSQAYAHGVSGGHRTPPWAQVSLIDPTTGEEAAGEQPGLVRWVDLANVDGVLALETQDLAVRAKPGFGQPFRLIGRLPQVPKRGCSLDAEELKVGTE